jgi:hypothetical protein
MEPVRWGILSTARINHAVLEHDTLRNIQNVTGSNLAETITGNEQRNTIDGRGGNDGADADTLTGGANADTFAFTFITDSAGSRPASTCSSRNRSADIPRRSSARSPSPRSRPLVMEAFMYRHHPQTRKLEEIVSSGAIGELRQLRSTFSFTLDKPMTFAGVRSWTEVLWWISAATASARSACSPASRKDWLASSTSRRLASRRGSPVSCAFPAECSESSTARTTCRKTWAST